MGSEGCADCHQERVKNFRNSPHFAFVSDPKLPLEKRGCEGCHGPGRIHQAEDGAEVISFTKMTPAESSAACLRCHATTMNEPQWKKTHHAKADLACVSCHQIHPESETGLGEGTIKHGNAGDPRTVVNFAGRKDPLNMLKADEATLCGSCHLPQVTEFKHASHHPVPEGRVLCSDCHSTHPTRAAKIKAHSSRGACVTCHTEFAGPFLYEHDPAAGFSTTACEECHRPHGTNNPKLLNSVTRGLCGQCHTDKLAGHHPGNSCWSAGCHVATHGSNSSPLFLAP